MKYMLEEWLQNRNTSMIRVTNDSFVSVRVNGYSIKTLYLVDTTSFYSTQNFIDILK